MEDVPSVAPSHVCIYKNTSCMNDEYIAHRVGMIPFSASGMVDLSQATASVSSICVSGRNARSKDVSGSVSVAADFLLLVLTEEQSFHADVCFDVASGRKHARYCSVVSPRVVGGELLFDAHPGRDKEALVLLALKILSLSALRAVRSLEEKQ